MNRTKKKAPGCTPRPSEARVAANAVLPLNEQLNSGTATAGEQVNRPEPRYLASIAYGEVVEATASRAQTKRERYFELIDHYTLGLMLEAGLAEQVSLYLLLSECSSYEPKSGTIRYYPVTRAELARRLGKSESTVSRWLSKLEAGGFVSTYYQRQTESPGVSRVAGNAYVLEHRSMRGREAAIYYETVIDTANSEPMTQSTEVEVELEVESNPGKMTLGLQVLSTPNRPTSSSTATATSTTSYSNLTTPLVKSDELVITNRDLVRDLFKPDGKKTNDLSSPKSSRASEAQLSALKKHLGSYERAALTLYELSAISELSTQQADSLIKHTQGLNPQLTAELNRIVAEQRRKQEQAAQAREAANQAQRDYEATTSYEAELTGLYGRVLTEAEQGERLKLLRAALRERAPLELRAKGKRLSELEADTALEASLRYSQLLEVMSS